MGSPGKCVCYEAQVESVLRSCPACRREYAADPKRLKHGRQTTCSRKCSYRLRGAGQSTSEQLICAACSKPVLRQPKRAARPRHGKSFCSTACAYSQRSRTVSKPYVYVAVTDRQAAARKAAASRRANAKPYPESARERLRANAVAQLSASQVGFGVSKFELRVAATLARLGFEVAPSHRVRDPATGKWSAVFDIYLPQRGILLECNGNYFHGGQWSWLPLDRIQAGGVARDERKARLARELHLDLRVVWESSFSADPVGSVLSALR